jgi:hypothetical protein
MSKAISPLRELFYSDLSYWPGGVDNFGVMTHTITQTRTVSYRFFLHQHPYVHALVRRLLAGGTAGLQSADTEYVLKNDGEFDKLPDGKFKPTLYSEFFTDSYQPSPMVDQPYPLNDLDFTAHGAYAIYNWELFFHVPFTIAVHLSKNQRFAEAQRWFHYIFDPTDDSPGPTPERFWKVRPFQYTDVKKVEELLTNLATGDDPDLRNDTLRSIEAWQDAPFRPHVVARYRQQAYMYKTVMAYLDNLVDWGDSLFRQDTGEAIDEAMQLYVLAANILGPRPLPVPKKGTMRPQTYANLRQDLARFGTVLREVEAEPIFDLLPLPSSSPDSGDTQRLATVRSLGKALYFAVPPNDQLIGYWDTVADRLFKIRNSLNIQGVFRQLALFEPPIDPAMLARATAAGLDVGAVVSGANQPLPLVRFNFLIQKALEIVQEVKSMGAGLLAALEKEDNESMAILRAHHEQVVLEMVEHVKYGQLQESIKAREGLLSSLALAVQRFAYYEKQLGRKQDEIEQSIPDIGDLDRDSLEAMKFAMKEPELPLRSIEADIASDLGASGGRIVSRFEREELDKQDLARALRTAVEAYDLTAKALKMIPDFGLHAHFWGIGPRIDVIGGTKLGDIMSLAADVTRTVAGWADLDAARAAKIGGYARREEEWAHQSNLAAGELSQVFKQLRAAQIREAVAELELKSHRQQMKHAEEIRQFLNEEGTEKTGKKTNKSLYTWMKREVRGLYSQCFQFAFDAARKAERALCHELGDSSLTYLQFAYMAGKEGLLAGEKLYLDVKRMETAYHELNQREYELTKHVSVLQLDPLALLQLRTTGRCIVRIPEAAYDMDGPGHYFRRVRSVAVSIPCVTGPYTGVCATLTLLKSTIRKDARLIDGAYERQDDDDRFSDSFASTQSIVTSSGLNDPGVFEPGARDERYLPFENAGAVSEWQLQLSADPSKGDPTPFDFNTISDALLHVRYTAREGGGLLRGAALARIKELLDDGQGIGSIRLFSLRQEFPVEWDRFQNQTPTPGQPFVLTFTIRPEHYPFWCQPRLAGAAVSRVDLLARPSSAPPPSIGVTVRDGAGAVHIDTLTRDAALAGLLVGRFASIPLPSKPIGDVGLGLDTNALADLWVAVTWNKS